MKTIDINLGKIKTKMENWEINITLKRLILCVDSGMVVAGLV